MQTVRAPISFEPLPFIVESLPLTIRWRLERPLDSSIEVVLASFGQGHMTTQLTPNFVLDTEHNLRSGIIPRIDLDPGLYVVLAMNRTSRNSILAASQSFYFLPTASTLASIRSGSNAHTNSTSLQKSGACDIPMPSTLPLPHLHSQMMAVISMSAFLSLSVVITLFVMLWRSFSSRRVKENSSEEGPNHTAQHIHPFVLTDCQSVISSRTEKSRGTLKDQAYSLSSSLLGDTPISFNTYSSSPASLSPSLPTSLRKPPSTHSFTSKIQFAPSAQNHNTSSESSTVSAGQRNSSPPPHYCVDTQPE